MRVVFCGFGRAGLECFYQLCNTLSLSMHDVIVFTHDVAENKEFIEHLSNNNITFYFDSVNEYFDELVKFSPDLLLSVYYRYIIKSNVLQLVDYKAMNLHPSLLPAYRGTKSSVWALINKEKETGISFHYITEKVDDGKIILQKKVTILDSDTAYSLYNKLVSLFILNFSQALSLLINGYEGEVQKGQISYYKRELPFNGQKNAEEVLFEDAKQFVKAMYFPPYKGAFFSFAGMPPIEIKTVDELEQYKSYFKEVK